MENVVADFSWYAGKKVLLTGHTGFKGAWLCRLLLALGAEVYGYALPPEGAFNLYELSGIGARVTSCFDDIRNGESLARFFVEANPDIAIHMAAQPLVLEGYHQPVYTYETNVMGTVHFLECLRHANTVQSALVVTTDKVYENKEWPWGYRESDTLGGADPYANSKSCAELVSFAYAASYLREKGIVLSTARSGNVIGGGDFTKSRILPDCVSAALEGKEIVLRHPDSVRPYQHVLEALVAYLLIVQAQSSNPAAAGSYNIGPDVADCVSTQDLATLFCRQWGENLTWRAEVQRGAHESNILRLDNSLFKTTFHWKQVWTIQTAVEKTVEWAKAHKKGEDMAVFTDRQIGEYLVQ